MVKPLAAIAFALALSFAGAGPAQAQYVMDLGSLIAALRIGDFSGDIENLQKANRVYVERVSRLSGIRVSGDRLDGTVAARRRVLRYLHAIIRQVPEAMKALDRHGQTLDQVIFLTTTNDGTAMLYVDDR
ncbi:MAG: hypothetical protein Q8L54_00975 [Devosia sp.]|nr:hypothetical protein [Devosia sp.]